MKLACPGCGWSAEVPDDRLPPPGSRTACRSCQLGLTFDGHGLVDDNDTPIKPLDAVVPEDDTPVNPLPAVSRADLHERSAPASSAQAAGEWYVQVAGAERGPLDLNGVKGLIRSGELTEHSYVFPPGAAEWVSGSSVADLKRYFAIKAKAAGTAAPAAGAAPAAAATAAAATASTPLAATDLDRCSNHGLDTTWQCGACGGLLCDQCLVRKEVPQVGEVKLCPGCGGGAIPRTLPKDVVPFWKELGDVLSFPVRGRNWIVLAVVTVCGAFVNFAGAVPSLMMRSVAFMCQCALFAVFLMVLREASTGSRNMPNFGMIGNFYTEMVMPGVRGLFVAVVAWVPLITYFCYSPPTFEMSFAEPEQVSSSEAPAYGRDEDEQQAFQEAMTSFDEDDEGWTPPAGDEGQWGSDDESGEWGDDWDDSGWGEEVVTEVNHLNLVVYPVLALYALFVTPILWIIVSLHNNVLAAFNPPLVLRLINEVRVDYVILVIFLGFVFGGSFIVNISCQAIDPYMGPVFAAPIDNYVSFTAFYAMGRVAEQLEQVIDW